MAKFTDLTGIDEFDIHKVIIEPAVRKAIYQLPERELVEFAGSIKLQSEMSHICQKWLVTFIKDVLSSKPEIQEWQKVDSEIRDNDIEYPATWIQAILDRFVPHRWTSWRKKIRYNRRLVRVTCTNVYQKRIYNQCPHVINAPRDAHIAFLASEPNDSYLKATSQHWRAVAISDDEKDPLLDFLAALSMHPKHANFHMEKLLEILGMEG